MGSHQRTYWTQWTLRKVLAAVISALIVIVTVTVFWAVKRQGLAEREYAKHLPEATVSFDESGIPTITAGNWAEVAKAQGFVVASERMWQMDLIRRKAGGRLAAWFGPKALDLDIRAQREDRANIMTESARLLPPEHREFCESYALGVNQFIEKFPGRWGIEYTITGQRPEPWRCEDTLLVILSMAETLSSSSENELTQAKWRKVLPPAWENFIYTMEHPWNKPYFNERERNPLVIPNGADALPAKAISAQEFASRPAMNTEPYAIGSNSWAWHGPAGSYLANDPHLGQSTPQIWYALRLKTKANEWVTGVALPGLPGVILGMNPSLAWAFTNVGEDVDDLLEEEINPEGTKYAYANGGSGKQWQDIEITTVPIEVKGDRPHQLQVRKTHRGPLVEMPAGSGKFYSRQWLPLKPGRLGLPTLDLNRAKNWNDLNAAADRFAAPAQNILIMDRKGNIGYRASGTGVVREVTGRIPQPANVGEWRNFAAPAERPRLWIEAEKNFKPTSMATANQRMWVDRFGHGWYGEDRQERITSVLASRNNHLQEQMLDLQLDTTSRFRRELLYWLAVNSVSSTEAEKNVQQKWLRWDGSGQSEPSTFDESITSEHLMYKALLGRLKDHFKPELGENEKYHWKLERAWLVALITKKNSFTAFGLNDSDLATAILQQVAANPEKVSYQERNKWNGQHPFVKNVPFIGWFFKVRSQTQYGYADLVRAEKPDHGPSVRIIWNLAQPSESVWMFPVGQSGHIGSSHYSDLQKRWAAGGMMKIMPEAF